MGKRIAAALVAVAMIGGALWWRSAADSTDSPTAAEPTTEASSVVCPADLLAACTAAASSTGIKVERGDVDATVSEASPPAAWVTVSPMPAAATFGTTVKLTETPIATSTLTLVVLNDRAAALSAACGGNVTWVCLGDNAGVAWTEIGGKPAWGNVRPGLSSSATAIGALSVTAAVTSYFEGRSVDTTDASFISWARDFARTVPPASLSAGTAVETIQVRSSTLDIAAGAVAELAPANESRFDTVPVGDAIPINIVLATAPGAQVPDKFVDELRGQLTKNGWTATTDSPTSTAFSGGDVRAALAAWKEMQ